MRRTQNGIKLAFAAALSLGALVACGSSSSPPDSNANGSDAAATPASVPTAAPQAATPSAPDLSTYIARCQRALDEGVMKPRGLVVGTVKIDSTTATFTATDEGTLTANTIDPMDGNADMGKLTCTGLTGATTHVTYNMNEG